MSLHKSFKAQSCVLPECDTQADPWKFKYPNTADRNFNYWHLLHKARETGIAEARQPHTRIAIVGAGVAGLTAARELLRCGYTHIDIYEATDRIGGRIHSVQVPSRLTTCELGAMRMPLFWPEADVKDGYYGPGSKNCVLDYFFTEFGISTQNFPNPGSAATQNTGIYMNDGRGPNTETPAHPPELLVWRALHSKEGVPEMPPPPAEELRQVYEAWSQFANRVTAVCQPKYGTPDWDAFWQQMVQRYWKMNFRELVFTPALSAYDEANPGDFGGLGLNEKQAWTFYVMGAGDGGWGAFYDISALYPLRTLLFGYSSNLQMVQGTFADGQFTPGPELALPVLDSLDQPLSAPAYLGLQSLPESLFYRPCPSAALPQSESPSQSYSLYQATREMEHVNLFTRCPVTGIHRQDDGSIRLHSSLSPKGKLSAQNARVYDAVICTESTWALQMGSAITGFDYAHLPAETTLSLQESHWITSCKVFYPLKQRYWEAPNPNGPGFDPIPQCISTDTFIQDAYGVAADVGDTRDPGALLVSYTWEDDCAKLEADEDEAAFARRCLGELDRVLLNSSNIKTTISQYVNESFPVVIRWERQPRYRGCAKLYRERSWMLDYALLRYNQDFSAVSGLYFAGEGYSVEGGWTEPALRGALDAVIHLNHNHGATFMEGFSMDLYPRYSAWNPAP